MRWVMMEMARNISGRRISRMRRTTGTSDIDVVGARHPIQAVQFSGNAPFPLDGGVRKLWRNQ